MVHITFIKLSNLAFTVLGPADLVCLLMWCMGSTQLHLCSALAKGVWHGSNHKETIRTIQNMERSTKLTWTLQKRNIMKDQEKKGKGLLILGKIRQWQPNAKYKWLDLGLRKVTKSVLGTTGDIWMDCMLDSIIELMLIWSRW